MSKIANGGEKSVKDQNDRAASIQYIQESVAFYSQLETSIQSNPPFLKRSLFYNDNINKERRKNYAKQRKDFDLVEWGSDILETLQSDNEKEENENNLNKSNDIMMIIQKNNKEDTNNNNNVNNKKESEKNSERKKRKNRELEELTTSTLKSSKEFSDTYDIVLHFNYFCYFGNNNNNSRSFISNGCLYIALYSVIPNYSYKQIVGSTYRYESSKSWLFENETDLKSFEFEVGGRDVKNLETKILIFYFFENIRNDDDDNDNNDDHTLTKIPKFIPNMKCSRNQSIQDHLLKGRSELEGNWYFAQLRLYDLNTDATIPDAFYNVYLFSISENSSKKNTAMIDFRLKWRLKFNTSSSSTNEFGNFGKSSSYLSRSLDYQKKQRKKRKLLTSIRSRKPLSYEIASSLFSVNLQNSIIYNLYNSYSNLKNQTIPLKTEQRFDFRCPFCDRRSIHVLSLLFHLITFHDRFDFHLNINNKKYFEFSVISKTNQPNNDHDHLINNNNYNSSFCFIFDNRERIEMELLAVVAPSTLFIDTYHRKPPINYHDTQNFPKDIIFYHSTGAIKEGDSLAYDSEDEIDMSWLIQKMEMLIDKCDDLSNANKKFMKLWNKFIMVDQHVDCDRQIPSFCLQFTKKYVNVFRSSRPMKLALITHLINLWDYSLIDQHIISACIFLIKSPF